MLPSGSSLFHPHLQGIADPSPTTLQRQLADVPAARFDDYLDTERRAGVRFLGNSGQVQWLLSFAPIAPAELRAFVRGVASPAELHDELVAELAHGLTAALSAYADMGYESFNLAIYGAPPGTVGYPLNLRIACRSNLSPFTARTPRSWNGCIGKGRWIWRRRTRKKLSTMPGPFRTLGAAAVTTRAEIQDQGGDEQPLLHLDDNARDSARWVSTPPCRS
jgi:hypothetical protein